MSATQAARTFSEVLNRVAAGEEIEIVRTGAAVAMIGPPRVRTVSAQRFRELMATIPSPDDEFGDDLDAIRRSVPPPDDPWAS